MKRTPGDLERYYAGLSPQQRPRLMALQLGSVAPLVLLGVAPAVYLLVLQLVCVAGLMVFRRRTPDVQATLVALCAGVVAVLVTVVAMLIA